MPDHELLDLLRLVLVPGLGPRMQRALLEHFGSAGRILAATSSELRRVAGVGPKLAEAITGADTHAAAERQLERCRSLNVGLLVEGSDDFPTLLGEIFDPPAVLYTLGDFEPRDEIAVALVGSRRCSHYGRQQAEKLAGGLARAGVTVISGLARGIDGAAHRAALQAGGRTIAVMATGLANVYPPEHADLAAEIAGRGVVVTEAPLDQEALPGLFPQRNRLIAGLSLGVVVVEATRKSGALHTVRHANEQGRSVLAVPGRIDSPSSEGCHDLIRDGVTLCRSVDDILESLGPLPQPVATEPSNDVHDPRELTLTDQERAILNLVDIEPKHTDEILRGSGLETSRVLATLTVLEMKRMIRRLPGGYLVRPH